jgi:hypothetical protein
VLIGDGALNYRRERILETYYAYALNKQITLTADYQLITNPAYNADRGRCRFSRDGCTASFDRHSGKLLCPGVLPGSRLSPRRRERIRARHRPGVAKRGSLVPSISSPGRSDG